MNSRVSRPIRNIRIIIICVLFTWYSCLAACYCGRRAHLHLEHCHLLLFGLQLSAAKERLIPIFSSSGFMDKVWIQWATKHTGAKLLPLNLYIHRMYQCEVDVDMLNAVTQGTNLPLFCSDEGLTLETSTNTLLMPFSISTSTSR